MITVHDQNRLISAEYVDESLVAPSSTQSSLPPPQDTLLDTILFAFEGNMGIPLATVTMLMNGS
jgi:hypothetical protein